MSLGLFVRYRPSIEAANKSKGLNTRMIDFIIIILDIDSKNKVFYYLSVSVSFACFIASVSCFSASFNPWPIRPSIIPTPAFYARS